MDKVTREDIAEIARLSGFVFSEQEMEVYQEQFQEIINYIERLAIVDTEDAEPTYQVTGLKNSMREDEIIDYGVSTDDLLMNAPMKEKNQIKVRRVL